MLSIEIAKKLRDAGLVWRPLLGDMFHIPDRNLDERLFVISDLSTDVTTLVDGIGAITFNGSVEWSLDYILSHDVVWVPSEEQLRQRLGNRFVRLIADRMGYEVWVEGAGEPYRATDAADAYGLALLDTLGL